MKSTPALPRAALAAPGCPGNRSRRLRPLQRRCEEACCIQRKPLLEYPLPHPGSPRRALQSQAAPQSPDFSPALLPAPPCGSADPESLPASQGLSAGSRRGRPQAPAHSRSASIRSPVRFFLLRAWLSFLSRGSGSRPESPARRRADSPQTPSKTESGKGSYPLR